MNKAVFLDRDGTINIDYEYVHRVEDFQFIPGAVDALSQLSKTDFKIVVITDQSGIGRGYYKMGDTEIVHDHMLSELAKNDIRIDGIYCCPHAPEDGCECRKPGTLLIKKAEEDFNIDLSKSYFVGDKTKDIKAGKNAGCTTVLVLTGKGGKDKEYDVDPDHTAKDLKDAVDFILKNEKQNQDKS